MAKHRVSVIGAGNVGATLGMRVAESGLADVTLVDVVEGMPQGKALDLMEAAPVAGRGATVSGTNDVSEVAGSEVVVITAGLPRKPGMSREELASKNADIVGPLAERVAQYAPQSVLLVVSNPLDVMTHLAWRRSGFDAERVVGMAGVLDASRFACFVAMELGISPADVRATVLGGHGDSMLLLPRYTSVSGIPVTELIEESRLGELVERARKGGAEIVSLLKTGSAYYAPSASVCAMVEAVLADRKRIFCASAYLSGQYGLEGVHIGVPVKLGAGGAEEVIELALDREELASLHASVAKVREGIEALAL